MKQPVITKYTINGDPRQLGADDVHIELVKQLEGPPKWAIRRMGTCLNKFDKWEWEPMPSSRDDDFLARCRFDSLEEAFAVLGVAAPATTRQCPKPRVITTIVN